MEGWGSEVTGRAGLFSFPNPVNEVAARLVAAGVAVMAALVLALQQPWFLAVMAAGFLARALTGPRISPLALLVTRVVVPRLGIAERPVPGPPKRFAQAIGVVVTGTAAALHLVFGLTTWAYALTGIILLFALLESGLGLCVGCKLFGVLMRLGVVPDDVCADCADIWSRAGRTTPEATG